MYNPLDKILWDIMNQIDSLMQEEESITKKELELKFALSALESKSRAYLATEIELYKLKQNKYELHMKINDLFIDYNERALEICN